jgi:hypothetical protein
MLGTIVAAASTVALGAGTAQAAPGAGVYTSVSDNLEITLTKGSGAPLNAVDVPWASHTAGENLWMYPSNDTNAQKWLLDYRTTTSSGDWYVLKSQNSPTLCLEAEGTTPSNGQPVQQHTCDGSYTNQPNQLWRFNFDSQGTAVLTSKMGTGNAWKLRVSGGNLVMGNGLDSNYHWKVRDPIVEVLDSVSLTWWEETGWRDVRCPEPYWVDEHDYEDSGGSDAHYQPSKYTDMFQWWNGNEDALQISYNNPTIFDVKGTTRVICNLMHNEPGPSS